MNNKNIDCDFYIFNDGVFDVDDTEVIKYISGRYNTVVDSLDDCAKALLDQIDSNDCYLCVGEGGERFFNAIQKHKQLKNVEFLVWHRVWSGEKEVGIETNIDQLQLCNKKIVLIEDVVASGETILKIIAKLQQKGCTVTKVVAAIMSGNSKLLHSDNVNIKYARVVGKKNSKDAFWFPAIYSYRHLFFGDEEMPKIYEIMQDKYFDGEQDLKQIILRSRKWKANMLV